MKKHCYYYWFRKGHWVKSVRHSDGAKVVLSVKVYVPPVFLTSRLTNLFAHSNSETPISDSEPYSPGRRLCPVVWCGLV